MVRLLNSLETLNILKIVNKLPSLIAYSFLADAYDAFEIYITSRYDISILAVLLLLLMIINDVFDEFQRHSVEFCTFNIVCL